MASTHAQQIEDLSVLAESRINNFNLMRMLAAAGVLLSHAFPIALGRNAAEPGFSYFGITLGTICVYVFFVLSGFLVAKSFESRLNTAHFFASRILRIFPALAVCLLVTIAVGHFITTAETSRYLAQSFSYFARNFTLFFSQNSLPGVFESNPFSATINGSLWTLSYEVLCYAITFFLGVMGALRRKILFCIFFIFYLTFYWASFLTELHSRITMLLQLGLPYLIGSAFWIFRGKILIKPLYANISLVAFTALLFLKAPVIVWIPFFAYLIFFFGYINFQFLLLYNRIGDYSYGVYIYAFPVQQFFAQYGTATPASNILASLPVVLAFAVLSWHTIEKPALRWKTAVHSGKNVKFRKK